jgi:hypothetical protein
MGGKRPARPQALECRTLLSDTMWSLIEECWAQTPALRPSMQDAYRRVGQISASRHEGVPVPRNSSNRRSYRELAQLSIPSGAPMGPRPLPTPPLSASPTVHALFEQTPVRINYKGMASASSPHSSGVAGGANASPLQHLPSANSSISHTRQWSLYDNTLVHSTTRDIQIVPNMLFHTSSSDRGNPHARGPKLSASRVCPLRALKGMLFLLN